MDVLPGTWPNPDNNVMKLLGEYVQWQVVTGASYWPNHIGSIMMKKKYANGVTELAFYFDAVEFDIMKGQTTGVSDVTYVCDGPILSLPYLIKNVVMSEWLERRFGVETIATTPPVVMSGNLTAWIINTNPATNQYGIRMTSTAAAHSADGTPIRPFYMKVLCMDE